MKLFIGILGIILDISLGLYLGGYIMLIGGIVQIVESATSEDINALGIGFGVARCLFSALVGWLAVLIIGLPSLAVIQNA